MSQLSMDAENIIEKEEEADFVPITKVKDCDVSLKIRLKHLVSHFRSRFNVSPEFIVRVPGRVNLIGEHIDYCGYAVCPMAIEQDILVAVSTVDTNELRLTNIMNDIYPEFHFNDFANVGKTDDQREYIAKEFPLSEAFRSVLDDPVEKKTPSWHNYFLCGIKGAMEVMQKDCDAETRGKKEETTLPSGLLVTVWGNIPANSGLSSSSALVSAAVLATTHASQCRMSKQKLATLSAKAERYIGTQGGGMDQAIAFLGKSGTAKLIEFNPLRATDVTLPANAVFVIAHSLASHNKASSNDYNQRVAECRFAAKIIAKRRNLKWQDIEKLSNLQTILDRSHEDMVCLVMSDLHEEPYSLDELCQILETTRQNLGSEILVNEFEGSQRSFKLRQRALHVFQEAGRVVSFRRISEDPNLTDEDRIRQLGSLMSKSHASLKKLYECSHSYVDELVEMAIECGAYGARLTGAGWGGCVVTITTKSDVSRFVKALKEKLRHARDIPTEDDIDNLVFPTEPNQGADLYCLS